METLIIFLLGIIMLSCSNREIDQNLYFYDLTWCSNPWNTGKNNSTTKTDTALRKYFEDLNVNILDVCFQNILQEGENTCDACSCLSGIRITVNIPITDNERFLMLDLKRLFEQYFYKKRF